MHSEAKQYQSIRIGNKERFTGRAMLGDRWLMP